MLTRDEAWELVTTHTASPSLRRHMLSVEAAMRAYAPRFGGDPELWGTVGLLHDFDYEQNPDVAVEGHPVVGSRILRERGRRRTHRARHPFSRRGDHRSRTGKRPGEGPAGRG